LRASPNNTEIKYQGEKVVPCRRRATLFLEDGKSRGKPAETKGEKTGRAGPQKAKIVFGVDQGQNH